MAPLETHWRDSSPSRPILAAKQPSLFVGVTVFRQFSRRFCRRYLPYLHLSKPEWYRPIIECYTRALPSRRLTAPPLRHRRVCFPEAPQDRQDRARRLIQSDPIQPAMEPIRTSARQHPSLRATALPRGSALVYQE